MLTFKTVVRKSPLHGVGVFAAEPVPKGALVYRWDPLIDTQFQRDEIPHMPEWFQEILNNHAVQEGDNVYLDGGNAFFMNHSDSANTAPYSNNDTWYATRNIRKGEEVTCDYSNFDYALCAKGDFRGPKPKNKALSALREFVLGTGTVVKSGGAPSTYIGPQPDQPVATDSELPHRTHLRRLSLQRDQQERGRKWRRKL